MRDSQIYGEVQRVLEVERLHALAENKTHRYARKEKRACACTRWCYLTYPYHDNLSNDGHHVHPLAKAASRGAVKGAAENRIIAVTSKKMFGRAYTRIREDSGEGWARIALRRDVRALRVAIGFAN